MTPENIRRPWLFGGFLPVVGITTPEALYYSDHRRQLVVAALILLASLLLTPAPPGGNCVSLLGYDLPPVCPHQVLFHHSCPGCGLTRSFVALAHGRFQDSLAFHRLGWFLFLLVLLQVPFRLFMLNRDRRPYSGPMQFAIEVPGQIVITALIANWILQMFHV